MSAIIKLREARATLLYVESILYWQANKVKPSPTVIREKDTPSDTLDSFHSGRREAIERTIVRDKSQLPTIDDIVGQIEAKKALMEAVVDPVLYPEWFATSGHNPWRCVLLYGPPGTGKTRLAQSVAREMNTRFYQVTSSDLISTWSGQSEKLIRELFDHALAHNGSSVIFIDEIDSLCRIRQVTEDDNIRRVKTELFLQLQRLHSSLSSVLLICATNCPWELDAAFLRRFEKRIFVGLPDAASRRILFKKFLNKLTVSSDIDWNVLETVTDGFSGDDLRRFAREVAFLHFNKFKIDQILVKHMSLHSTSTSQKPLFIVFLKKNFDICCRTVVLFSVLFGD
ncbi:hypothetical protein LOAG_08200 [Loa loa]|uniref:AAA+ ATPase domain-containing protein n=1 Tax=Loa loa TaxID=7209 RepID=A0A1S0TU73_LOALO|nr:hypothetical protein LOAG_08200 [Loa loa]EFO20291.2 hypothetical protein LOAG_08200 [Loa loa]